MCPRAESTLSVLLYPLTLLGTLHLGDAWEVLTIIGLPEAPGSLRDWLLEKQTWEVALLACLFVSQSLSLKHGWPLHASCSCHHGRLVRLAFCFGLSFL